MFVLRRGLARPLGSIAIAVGIGLAPPPATASKPGCKHRVESGDTVSEIARQHGVSEANLVQANRALKKNPNRLRVGQILEICRAKRLAKSNPAKCGDGGRIVRHQVDRGDTLISIARKYSVDLRTLRRYNRRLRKSSMIRVGESLRVCTRSRRWTHRSWLRHGVQLPPSQGYERRPHHAWGTPLAIQGIVEALARYRRNHPEAPPVRIGDISRKRGGPLGSHLSHQEGRDVDVFFVYEDDDDGGRTLDLERSWGLLESFLVDERKLGAVFISYGLQRHLYRYALSTGVEAEQLDAWFEFPRNDDEAVVYHWPGHTGHFHVRYVEKLPGGEDATGGSEVGERASKTQSLPLGIRRRRAVVQP